MKKFLKFLILCVLAISLSNSSSKATGIGVFTPLSFNSFEHSNYSVTGYGFGFVLDTRVAKKGLVNYRLNIGTEFLSETYTGTESYWNPQSHYDYYYGWQGGYDYRYVSKSTLSMLISIDNTIGFGIVTNKILRFWAGPQIRLSPSIINDVRDFAFGVGTAPVVGINFNFGKLFTVGADMGYRYTYYFSTVHSYNDYGQYGLFINANLIFRLNDVYKR